MTEPTPDNAITGWPILIFVACIQIARFRGVKFKLMVRSNGEVLLRIAGKLAG